MIERQKEMPIEYEGVAIDVGYRLDLLVNNEVEVELKSVAEIAPIHEAQILSYLRVLCGKSCERNSSRLRYRIIHYFEEESG